MRQRIAALMLVGFAAVSVFALAGPALPALAQVAPEEAGGPAAQQPAVTVAEVSGEAESEEAWTFRFLVPTVVAIAAAVLVATSAAYGMRVRGRYRVVR